MPLGGKKALVTGAQQGIGRAIAIRFAREGADVVVNYLDDAGAAGEIAAEIEALGCKALTIQADIGAPGGPERLVAAAYDAFGSIDVLVNNAAVFPRAWFVDMPEEVWSSTLAVNLSGTCFTAQAVVRRMLAAGTQGSIINLASGAIHGLARSAHYAAAKAGVVALTRTMALELADKGIRVNVIAPGLTDTAQPRIGFSEEQLVELARTIPLRRMGRPDEIAAAVAFLASDAASYITGQTLHVNGGAFMG